ncbi:hypothetical protein BDZ89DRAFT_1143917 [Hymenopellis radicata]|nr:hypothetical protein BDZ89DRAFT_1143917 [Hymenopellis radicata]
MSTTGQQPSTCTLRLYRLPLLPALQAHLEGGPSVSARNSEDFGIEGVLVVHDDGHPHILLLQMAHAFSKLQDRRSQAAAGRQAGSADGINASHGVEIGTPTLRRSWCVLIVVRDVGGS